MGIYVYLHNGAPERFETCMGQVVEAYIILSWAKGKDKGLSL